MRHYFVAQTEQKVMDMIKDFLFPYQVHIKDIKIELRRDQSFWGHVDFDNKYGDVDPRSDGMVHFDPQLEQQIMGNTPASKRYLRNNI